MSVKLAVNLAEKYLKEKFAQKLLSYISSFSGALKRIKYFIKKILPTMQRHEKHEIKNKTDKNWKRIWDNTLFEV